jgi:hypothetical protein
MTAVQLVLHVRARVLLRRRYIGNVIWYSVNQYPQQAPSECADDGAAQLSSVVNGRARQPAGRALEADRPRLTLPCLPLPLLHPRTPLPPHPQSCWPTPPSRW